MHEQAGGKATRTRVQGSGAQAAWIDAGHPSVLAIAARWGEGRSAGRSAAGASRPLRRHRAELCHGGLPRGICFRFRLPMRCKPSWKHSRPPTSSTASATPRTTTLS
ncbi:hypothetical protein CPCC7001_2184 [Cyanobium sp. PCC 7001]|nr:hypothetical protein CPCC7001_2184 [Cyanobium sp. PCC 7001]